MVVSLMLGSLPRAVAALVVAALVTFSGRSVSSLPSPAGLSRCTTRSGAAGRALSAWAAELGAVPAAFTGADAAVEAVAVEAVELVDPAPVADSAQPASATSAAPSLSPCRAPARLNETDSKIAGLERAALNIRVNRRPSPCQPIDSRIA